MKAARVLRHLFATRWGTRRRFTAEVLSRIESGLKRIESLHAGELQFAIETAFDLPELWYGVTPRQRALHLFGHLGVWDTAGNNGVLIYVLMADHDVEIVADRAIAARVPQAEYLAPEGYDVAYHTNAVTRHGEHGNALLSRWPLGDAGHHDVSDHRFEQRGLLHVPVKWRETTLHAVVAHLGLMHSGRVRQVERLARFVAAEVPPDAPLIVAGDFNDWGEKLDAPMHHSGLTRAVVAGARLSRVNTFPSRVPVFSLDRIYTRGLRCVSTSVPRGTAWARMSDHLPLVAELELT